MTKKTTPRIGDGTVVEFKRLDKTGHPRKRICFCGRADVDKHAQQHDCQLVGSGTPVGKAFLGKKVGDKVTVETECGIRYRVEITEIVLPEPAANAA